MSLRGQRKAVAALLLGATCIGFAPLLVRWSETGPTATAFYRILFALPLLWGWRHFTARRGGAQADAAKIAARPRAGAFLLAGFCFAGDMALWNWSLHLTSVANATLLTNLAPILVVIGARWLFGERAGRPLVFGMALAILGGAVLVEADFHHGGIRGLGDMLGLLAAVFYAGYILSVKHLRRSADTSEIMAKSGVASCLFLLPVAALCGEVLLAHTARGWWMLTVLGLVSHIGGQGLIAYALAHLGASFSSIGLLLQPVVAAALAALVLEESLSVAQCLGGAAVLAGIGLASIRPASFSNADKDETR